MKFHQKVEGLEVHCSLAAILSSEYSALPFAGTSFTTKTCQLPPPCHWVLELA